MTSALPACLAFSLGASVEGGYSDNPDDAGNYTGGRIGAGRLVGTNHGVSAPAWTEWTGRPVTAAIMRAITLDDVTPFYAARYWNPIRGDDLPAGVNLGGLDMQINAGMNGARCLQRAAGLTGPDVDGWIGRTTLAAIGAFDMRAALGRLSPQAVKAIQKAAHLDADGRAGPKTMAVLAGPCGRAIVLCGRFRDERMAHYRQAPGWPSFGRGWTARADACLGAALGMILKENVA